MNASEEGLNQVHALDMQFAILRNLSNPIRTFIQKPTGKAKSIDKVLMLRISAS